MILETQLAIFDIIIALIQPTAKPPNIPCISTYSFQEQSDVPLLGQWQDLTRADLKQGLKWNLTTVALEFIHTRLAIFDRKYFECEYCVTPVMIQSRGVPDNKCCPVSGWIFTMSDRILS